MQRKDNNHRSTKHKHATEKPSIFSNLTIVSVSSSDPPKRTYSSSARPNLSKLQRVTGT